MELTNQEYEMIELLREWSDKDSYALTIEVRDGAWEIAFSGPHPTTTTGMATARGIGKTFSEAWDDVAPQGA
jgi:hypothetical protein